MFFSDFLGSGQLTFLAPNVCPSSGGAGCLPATERLKLFFEKSQPDLKKSLYGSRDSSATTGRMVLVPHLWRRLCTTGFQYEWFTKAPPAHVATLWAIIRHIECINEQI